MRGHVPFFVSDINNGVIMLEKPQQYLGEQKALAKTNVLASSTVYNNKRDHLNSQQEELVKSAKLQPPNGPLCSLQK